MDFARLSRRTALQFGGGTAAASTLPALAATTRKPDFSVKRPDGVLCLYALSPRALRVRFTPSGAAPGESPMLLPHQKSPRLKQRWGRSGTILMLPFLHCEIGRDGGLHFTDTAGKSVLREAGRKLTPSSVRGEATIIAEAAFSSPPDERLYGTGQFQDGFLNIRGLCRRLTQVNTQISLPVLLSSKGWGLIWHNSGLMELNPADTTISPVKQATGGSSQEVNVTTTGGNAKMTRNEAVFEVVFQVADAGTYRFLLDCGQSMAHRHHVEIDGTVVADASNLWLPPTTSFFATLTAGEHKLRVLGDAKDQPKLSYALVNDETVLRSPVSEGVDYVVIAGSPEEVIAEYRKLTGAAPLMPKWAYGYIHCRERYHSSDEIIANAEEFRKRKIPLDAIVQDWQYWGKYGWNAMRFDETHYPDPAALTAKLHSIQVRFMLSVWSKVDAGSDLNKALAARNCFIPGTSWIDFFNPQATAFYWGAMRHNLVPLGIDAWWQDATEPENDDLVGRMTAAGIGEKVRLEYPLRVTRTVYEGLRKDVPDRRVMILTRSAFPGQQRYAAATWSGDIGYDWETLRRQIPAGLNMMAAGYPYWTVDAGGFFRPGESQYSDPVYHEIFLRWLQYATFLPLMRVHGYQTQTEPWRYGPEVEHQARALIEWRYRLLPYIYSTASEVTRKGSSLMRPLVMDFTQDPKALDERYSFMFGRALHVAPVLKPAVTEWEVYLPEHPGGWYDFWTNQHRDGGKNHKVEAPLDRIPLHVRAGSILPLGPIVQSTAEASGEDITLRVYPGADGRFDLYEDEGTNYRYEKGAFSQIGFAWNDAASKLEIAARQGRYPGMLEKRQFTVERIDGAGPAKGVAVPYSGKAVTLTL